MKVSQKQLEAIIKLMVTVASADQLLYHYEFRHRLATSDQTGQS